jgi:hypothetical protein
VIPGEVACLLTSRKVLCPPPGEPERCRILLDADSSTMAMTHGGGLSVLLATS